MAYRTMWEVEVRHNGLGKYRHIRGSDKYVVEQKARYQEMQWEEQWQRKLDADLRVKERNVAAQKRATDRERAVREKERLREETALEKARIKEEAQRYKDERKQEGIERDTEAKEAIEILKNTLSHTLKINDAIDWGKLKDRTTFKEPQPKLELSPCPPEQPLPKEPSPFSVPARPTPAARHNPPSKGTKKYQPEFGILDKIFASRKARKIADAEALYQQDYAAWVLETKRLEECDASELRKWEDNKNSIESRNVTLRADWERAVEKTKKENSDKKAWWEKHCEQIRAKHSDSTGSGGQSYTLHLSNV